MQHGDIYHPYHDHAAARGAPGASNNVNEAAVGHCTNTPTRATGGSLGVTMMRPTCRHHMRSHTTMGKLDDEWTTVEARLADLHQDERDIRFQGQTEFS
jgi:hypothetical protein